MRLSALTVLFAVTALGAETTIYVNKHFEVRDHDQPTKYVFHGNTRVAHITGSLSTNTHGLLQQSLKSGIKPTSQQLGQMLNQAFERAKTLYKEMGIPLPCGTH